MTRRIFHTRWRSVALVVCMLVVGPRASAQDSRQFFTLATPGARANAMGRAFVGVADDASAAVTNPAGLMFLTRPQVYGEFKGSFSDERLTNSSFVEGLDFESLRARLSFFAVSAPVGSRIAVAFSRHEFYAANATPAASGFGTSVSSQFRDRGTSYAGSVAAALAPDVKVGVSISSAELRSEFVAGGQVIDQRTFTGIGVTVGGLWQAQEKVSIGGQATLWTSEGDGLQVSPNQVRVGVGIVPTSRLRVAVDGAWVGYHAVGGLIVANAFSIANNSGEVHAGGEYQLTAMGRNRFFLRGGVYHENRGTTGTVGGGVAIGQVLQVDVAALTRKDVVVSAAVRF